MSPTSYRCSIPRRLCLQLSAVGNQKYTRSKLRALRCAGQKIWPWHWPIFPEGYPSSIVGAGAFHCRVRDGNGWCHPAQNTRTRFETCHPALPCPAIERRDRSSAGAGCQLPAGEEAFRSLGTDPCSTGDASLVALALRDDVCKEHMCRGGPAGSRSAPCADWARSCWRGKARSVAFEPSAISTA